MAAIATAENKYEKRDERGGGGRDQKEVTGGMDVETVVPFALARREHTLLVDSSVLL